MVEYFKCVTTLHYQQGQASHIALMSKQNLEVQNWWLMAACRIIRKLSLLDLVITKERWFHDALF